MTWREFAVPLAVPFITGNAAHAMREGLLVKAIGGGGVCGYGEASPLASYTGATIVETAAALEPLASVVQGKCANDAWQALACLPAPEGPAEGAARCGIETAIADLGAREAGVPLHRWLAERIGLPPAVGAVRIKCNATIDAGDTAATHEAVTQALAQGFRTIKVKAGAGPVAGDVARLRQVRAIAGPDVELRADANRAWSFEDALTFLDGVGGIGLAFVEEPLCAATPEQLVRLAAGSPAPLALDESCRSLANLERTLQAGGAQVLILKPMVCGLVESLRMLRLATHEGMTVVVTTTFDAAWGTALAAHVAALLPEPRAACGLATLHLLEQPLGAGAPPVERGVLVLGEAPGLGVAPEERLMVQAGLQA